MISTEGFTRGQMNDVGYGNFTITVGHRSDIRRQDGSPSQDGDVLSVQDDGTLQTRPSGSAGSFEVCKFTESRNAVVYNPFGKRTIYFPVTGVWD